MLLAMLVWHLFQAILQGRYAARACPGDRDPICLRHTYRSFNHCVRYISGTNYNSAKALQPLEHIWEFPTKHFDTRKTQLIWQHSLSTPNNLIVYLITNIIINIKNKMSTYFSIKFKKFSLVQALQSDKRNYGEI